MIERVAEALFATRQRNDPLFDYQESLEKDEYRRWARAAIAAMREPTEGMKQVGFGRAGDPCWQEDVGLIWRGMIDEALDRNALAKGEVNYRPMDEALK